MKKKTRKSYIKFVEVGLAALSMILIGFLLGVLSMKFIIMPKESNDSEDSGISVYREAQDVAPVPIATKTELLEEVNRRRIEAGVAPLQYSPELEATAQQKCDDMVANNYYGHNRPDGEPWYELMTTSTGWQGHFTENLMKQSQLDDSATTVFDGWMNSQPHKEALLSSHYTLTGFGICGDLAENSSRSPTYFVEHFYGPQ